MDEKRYRTEEQRLFEAVGADPAERWIDLTRVGGRARVLEAGSGEPVLFLHGGPNAGATWAGVLPHLDGIHAILLDRPGCGLSPKLAQVPDARRLPTYVEELTADVLDALDLDRASLVGSSLGGYSALRSAAALPERVASVFLAGAPPFVPGAVPPAFFKLLRAPILGSLVLGLPASKGSVRMGLKQMGHHKSLAANRIPDHHLRWELAWQGLTDTMRNDVAMIRACGTFRKGFDASLELTPEDLAGVTPPVHALVGADDPVGGRDVVERLAAALPRATVEIWEGAGHLPWLDDPARFAVSLQQAVLGLPR